MKEGLIAELQSARQFFHNSISCLQEEDSGYAPTPEMFTTAQQVEHVAQTIEWFFQGAFSPEGFDMNFEQHMAELKKCASFRAAVEHFDRAIEQAIQTLRNISLDELLAAFPQGTVMAGAPKFAIVNGIVDHCAHHRGALTVYARLLGKTPKMPYSEA